MTPEEFKEARLTLGLTLEEMGAMLGYSGAHVRAQVYKMEAGERDVREAQARLVRAYLDGYRPADWPVKA